MENFSLFSWRRMHRGTSSLENISALVVLSQFTATFGVDLEVHDRRVGRKGPIMESVHEAAR